MNFKALITTLVVAASSTAAMADSSFTVSGAVKVNLGTAHPAPAPVHHQPVVVDDCDPAPAPAYQPPARPPVVYQPPAQPVWRGPYFNPTNTIVSASASRYTGPIGTSPTKTVRRMGYGKSIISNRTVATTWFDLTEATRIDNGREYFKVGADKGWFKQIKLQGLGGGRSNIAQVAISYVDGLGSKKTQVVKLNTWLSASTPLTFDLEGEYRQIDQIVVYGSTDRGSAYKILAM